MKQQQKCLISRLVRLTVVSCWLAIAAFSSAGSVVQWGDSSIGQRTEFPPVNLGFVQVSAGSWHNLALKADGSIVQWGDSSRGQRTDFPLVNSGFIQVSAGREHNLALRADGSIVQWGDSRNGQRTDFPLVNSGFVQVSAGLYQNLALKADGSIVQWGDNAVGNRTDFPLVNSGFVQVSAAFVHNLALKADGSIVQWGDSSFGQRTDFPMVNSGFVQVGGGVIHNLALRKPARSWSFTRLHPFGAIESSAYAVDGAVQGGYVDYGAGLRATRWSGSNFFDIIDLGSGVVTALDGGREFGDSTGWAVSWNGTAASKAVLPYDWASQSWCTDAGDGQIVGFAFDSNSSFDNMIWTNPPPYVFFRLFYMGYETVLGVGGGVQVGESLQDYGFATMWRGTPESMSDLHPLAATLSVANGTDGIQQVGSAHFGGVEKAGFWRGTKDSWTLLHPIGATRSSARRVSNGMQVGFAVVGGVKRASYWEGSAGSWVDLGLSLPAEFAGMESVAKDIYVDGNTVTIVGDAINGLTNQREAVMWVSSSRAVDTAIDGNVDRFGKTLSNGATTLSRTLFLTMSGTADAGVDGFQYSVDGGPFKHCGKAVFLSSLSIGAHSVEVRAMDTEASVDLTPALLTFTVITPAQAVSGMISYIQSQGLPPATRNQLVPPLNQALNQLIGGNIAQAITLLNNFKSRVSQLRNQNRLTVQQAQYLTDQANAVIATIS